MARTVIFGMQKGGVGKTTLTVNFARWLAINGMKTLLIDADPQASATSFFDFDDLAPENTMMKLFDMGNSWNIVREDRSLILATGYENLFLTPAIIHMTMIENGHFEEATRRLDYWLKSTCGDFDYIVVDCPPSLGRLTSNALMAGDYVVVPCLPEPQSYNALEIYIDTISQIKKVHDIMFMGTVVNNYIENRSVHKLYERYVEEDGIPVLGKIHNCTEFLKLSHNRSFVIDHAELRRERIYSEITKMSEVILGAIESAQR